MAEGTFAFTVVSFTRDGSEPTKTLSKASSEAPAAEAKMQNWVFIWGIFYEEVRL